MAGLLALGGRVFHCLLLSRDVLPPREISVFCSLLERAGCDHYTWRFRHVYQIRRLREGRKVFSFILLTVRVLGSYPITLDRSTIVFFRLKKNALFVKESRESLLVQCN